MDEHGSAIEVIDPLSDELTAAASHHALTSPHFYAAADCSVISSITSDSPSHTGRRFAHWGTKVIEQRSNSALEPSIIVA